MVLREAGGTKPDTSEAAFVDESALLIGNVSLRRGSSVWPCALLRADDDSVEVGEGSAIMDMAFLEAPRGRPVRVGRGCLVSHGARLHGCEIGDSVLVGIGAIVLDGAKVGDWSVVAAGTLVPPGKEIPARTVVAGVPAAVSRAAGEADARTLSSELEALGEKARRYCSARRPE